MARWFQKILVQWWHLITISAWAVMLGAVSGLGYIMWNLTGAMQSLTSQIGAVKRFSIVIESNLRQMQQSVKESEVHLQAHSARMDVIESRIRKIEELKRGERASSEPAPLPRKGEELIIREYLIVPAPETPAKKHTIPPPEKTK